MKKTGLGGTQMSLVSKIFHLLKISSIKTILSIRRLTDTGSTVEGMKLFNQFL